MVKHPYSCTKAQSNYENVNLSSSTSRERDLSRSDRFAEFKLYSRRNAFRLTMPICILLWPRISLAFKHGSEQTWSDFTHWDDDSGWRR
jgi:hypothetical protein